MRGNARGSVMPLSVFQVIFMGRQQVVIRDCDFLTHINLSADHITSLGHTLIGFFE